MYKYCDFYLSAPIALLPYIHVISSLHSILHFEHGCVTTSFINQRYLTRKSLIFATIMIFIKIYKFVACENMCIYFLKIHIYLYERREHRPLIHRTRPLFTSTITFLYFILHTLLISRNKRLAERMGSRFEEMCLSRAKNATLSKLGSHMHD